ncbi:MAG: TAXI family TRAP transporter solute-binding subunit [Ectothiorhodospiraceae bacterium]|nr:TAXI family TRAP transporter solute-binding subunit [Ectothiorhodospiraceae bacterium]MCH8503977.1 TAXI family TRAP transporter solute-binding subunit [Ectothiorhodospiraceae bacterium]
MKQFARCTRTMITGVAAAGLVGLCLPAMAVELPRTVTWAAYPTGSGGYAQAVAIGSVLQNEYNVNLRVIPGRNDVSRLSPLRAGRVHFSAGGTEAIYAQEGLLDFGTQAWGPQALRAVYWSMSDGCSYTLITTADSGIETIDDVRGKRVPFVQGSPTLNNATASLLAYANMTWDDVQRVEFGGYMGTIDALLDGSLDVMGSSCNTTAAVRIDAGPRGLQFITFPHGDQEAIDRVTARIPWFVPHVATDGPTIDSEEGVEVFSSPYPFLVATAAQDPDLVYNMTKSMVKHYEDYKDNVPGGEGWALDRQGLETAFAPFHEGAIRYFKEAGVWTEAAERRQEANLRRQDVLLKAWEEYTAQASVDEQEFRQGWMEWRAQTLRDNDMILIMERW